MGAPGMVGVVLFVRIFAFENWCKRGALQTICFWLFSYLAKQFVYSR